jgi:hypothetical protein
MFHPRKRTAAEWKADNITLRNGESAVEKDTGKVKVGNGHTPWIELPYQFNQAIADLRYATKSELAAASGGPALTEDPNDLGTFIIQHTLTEDPADPGTFLIGV